MTHSERALQIAHVVTEKNKIYGDSAGKSSEILRVLYPDGVAPEQYDQLLLVVRVLDKISRVAQRGRPGVPSDPESPWADIAGYALLALEQEERRGKPGGGI